MKYLLDSRYVRGTQSDMLLNIICLLGGRDSSIKLSTSQAGDPGSNPGGELTWVTQCMNERGRDYQL